MPTYTYACPDGHTDEKFEPMTAPTQRPCQVCGKTMDRQINWGGGTIWKGGKPTPTFDRKKR